MELLIERHLFYVDDPEQKEIWHLFGPRIDRAIKEEWQKKHCRRNI